MVSRALVLVVVAACGGRTLEDEARTRALQPFVAYTPPPIPELDPPPDGNVAAVGLTFPEYNAIVTDKFHDDGSWAIETRPRGNVYRMPVDVRDLTADRTIAYDPARYDYTSPAIVPGLTTVPPAGRYIAGLQAIHRESDDPGSYPIIMVVNGDGYLRLTAEPPRTMGTSYRLAAHNVGAPRSASDPLVEDFPRIIKATVLVEDPNRLALGMLLDGELFAGVVRLDLTPGPESVALAAGRFWFRRAFDPGIEPDTGPLAISSMFYRGETDTPGDSTDEAHDSDTLVIGFSDGTTIERALANATPGSPTALEFAPPAGATITRIALEQRDRDAAHYAAFASAGYATRSSIAIEALTASVPVTVRLYVFHSDEYYDNVVAYLALASPIAAGAMVDLAYRVRAY